MLNAHRKRLCALSRDFAGYRLRPGLVHIGNDDIRTCRGKSERVGAANGIAPRPRSGDECHLSIDTELCQ